MRTALFTLLLLFFCLCLYATGGSPKNWKLIHKQDGVEFYSTSVTADLSQQTKTIIKIKNTNTFDTRLKFSTIISCGSDVASKENIVVHGQDMVMFTYKSCSDTSVPNMSIEGLSITK